jgi:Domain of unknown function (DUF1918)
MRAQVSDELTVKGRREGDEDRLGKIVQVDGANVQRYTDAIMAMIRENQDMARFPAAFAAGTNSMTASTSTIITVWPRYRRAPARRLACGRPCTMGAADAWLEHKVTHVGNPARRTGGQQAMAAGWRASRQHAGEEAE